MMQVLRSIVMLSLFAHACAANEGAEELRSSSSPGLMRDTAGKNYTAITLYGGPSSTSTTDCGSKSGSLPTISAETYSSFYYTQLGCSGLYTSMSVDFSLTNPSLNSVVMFVIKGSDCRSGITASTSYIAQFPTSGSGYFKQSCGNTDTCCVAIVCTNSIYACSGMSYTSNFITVVNGGAVSGIVIGGLIFIGLIAFGVRSCQHRRAAFSGQPTVTTVYEPIIQPMQNPVAQSYQGAAPYQGAQPSYQQQPNPGYQQPSYQQQQPSYQQQQPSYQQQQPSYQQQQQPIYNPPPQGGPTFMQPQPQAWGQSPAKY